MVAVAMGMACIFPLPGHCFRTLSIHISELTADYKQVVGAATTNLFSGGTPIVTVLKDL